MHLEWWAWIVGGIALIVAELAIPSFFVIWFGLGALLVGLLMLADLLWLGFNATVIYQGALLIDSMSTRPMVSGSMLLDLRYVYFAVPAAFTLRVEVVQLPDPLDQIRRR